MTLKPSRIRVINPLPPKKKIGLGDAVEAVAKPVAKVIDAVAGTNLQNCSGCQSRPVFSKDALNAAVPNINPFSD